MLCSCHTSPRKGKVCWDSSPGPTVSRQPLRFFSFFLTFQIGGGELDWALIRQDLSSADERYMTGGRW
jgi:hypothetical protein